MAAGIVWLHCNLGSLSEETLSTPLHIPYVQGRSLRHPVRRRCNPQSHMQQTNYLQMYTIYNSPEKALQATRAGHGREGLPGKPARCKTDPRGTGKGPQDAGASLFTEQPLNQLARRKAEGETKMPTIRPCLAHTPQRRVWQPHSTGRT